MATRIESADDFASTLAEVEVLLREADESAPGRPREDERRASVLNKAALLLLTGKFESFLESAAEEFLFAVNQVGGRASQVPLRLLAEHSVRAVVAIEQRLSGGDLAGVAAIFAALGKRWSEAEPCNDLVVSCKFSYGKHGENEIIRLFKRLGVDDVFERVAVVDDSKELYDGQTASPVDVKGLVNSLTGIRNNILHQDETPNLTSEDLREQSAVLKKFAVALVRELQSIADSVEELLRAEGVTGAC